MYSGRQPNHVGITGAPPGSVLVGVKAHNLGLAIQVHDAQPVGCGGPVSGVFRLLNAGNNRHVGELLAYVGNEMTAADLLAIVRRPAGACVSPVNANGLAVRPKRVGTE
jgi:hypothetical protein